MQKSGNVIFEIKYAQYHSNVKYALFKSKYRLSSAAKSRTEFNHVSDIANKITLPYISTAISKKEAVYHNLEKGVPVFGRNTVCFADLPRELQLLAPFEYNRIIYSLYKSIDDYINKEKTFTVEEVETYLALAKKSGCLPAYLNVKKAIKNSSIVLDIDTSKQLLFIYLTIFRTILHDPAIVKAVVYLVTELKLDFFKSLYLAHTCMCHNSNHSFFPATCFKYPPPKKITLDTPLPNIISDALRKVVSGETGDIPLQFRVDSQILKLIKTENRLESMVKASKITTLQQALKPSIIKQLTEAAHAN